MSGTPGPWWRRTNAPFSALVVLVVLAGLALAVAGLVVVPLVRTGPSVPRLHPTGAPTAAGTPSADAPTPGTASAGVTVAAVGDLVCDPAKVDEDGNGKDPRQCQQKSVSSMVLARRPAALLALGDTQYADGTLDAFRTTYAPTYGRLLDVTYPVPGNHEYQTPRAAGYYAYFGLRAGSPDRGYYSFDLGGWHLVALNSNCGEVSCAAGSAQERWLRADLAAHPAVCTLAFWHHPRWSHGDHGDNPRVAPLVRALYDGKADVMLAGHDHDYERYALRAPDGTPDPRGLRQFVVGTGGRNLRSVQGGTGTEAAEGDSFGALFLTLTPTGYSWRFTASNGTGYTDTGTTACH
jgi:hypothetical protein